jgi:flagellar hook-length control protein FliK
MSASETNGAGENTEIGYRPAIQWNELKAAEHQREVTPASRTTGIQEKTSFEHREVDAKASPFAPAVEFMQAKPADPGRVFSQRDADNGTKNVLAQTIVQESASALTKSDLPKVAPFQTQGGWAKPVFDPQHLEKEIDIKESVVEPSQTFPDDPIPSVSINHETETVNMRSQVIGRSTLPDLDVSDVAPFQTEMIQEELTTATENVDRPISADEFVRSQTTLQTIHPVQAEIRKVARAQTEIAVDDQLDMSAQRVIPGNPAQESVNGPTGDVKEEETREKSLPGSFVFNEETQVAPKPEVLTKADLGQQDLRADQTHLTDEKTHPVEKEFGSNEMLEPGSAATNAQKDFVPVGSPEKGRTAPVNLHAVEVVQQAVRQLNGRLQGGVASMHVQLNPDILGVIEVEMVRDAQGVSVTFFAEQASTGKLLETQLSQLRQSLVDSGVQLLGLNIGQHSHTGQEGGFQHQNMNFAQTSQHATVQREVHTQESPRAERMTGQMSEVDYLI